MVPARLGNGTRTPVGPLGGLTGTVSKPVVDHNAFQATVANLTRDSLKGVGKELLNKELEKLFPLMPKK